MTAPSADHPGSHGCYANRGCRAPACKEANAAYYRAYRQRPVDDGRHGTVTNYQRGCTCGPCLATAPATARARAWARANGYVVADRGRLPGGVLAAWARETGAGRAAGSAP